MKQLHTQTAGSFDTQSKLFKGKCSFGCCFFRVSTSNCCMYVCMYWCNFNMFWTKTLLRNTLSSRTSITIPHTPRHRLKCPHPDGRSKQQTKSNKSYTHTNTQHTYIYFNHNRLKRYHRRALLFPNLFVHSILPISLTRITAFIPYSPPIFPIYTYTSTFSSSNPKSTQLLSHI